MIDEIAILKQARKGDQHAIGKLVSYYQHMVRNYLYAMAPDPCIGDDLAQEAFVKFIRSMDRIDPKRGIKPYLMRIARNVAIDYWRKRDRRKGKYDEVLFSDLESYYDTASEQCQPHTVALKLEALKKCLQTLNDRLTRVIHGFYYQNLRCRELADDIGTSETNIRSLLYRARKALLKCIAARIKKAALR